MRNVHSKTKTTNYSNIIGKVGGAEEVTPENSMRVFRDGFIVLCNVVKPVTSVNAPYLAKRWASLQAACSGEGVQVANWQDIGGVSEESLERRKPGHPLLGQVLHIDWSPTRIGECVTPQH